MEYTEVERERLAKLERLRQAGIDPYPSRAAFVRERLMATEAIERAHLLKFESAAQPDAASTTPAAPATPPQSHLETGPVSIMGRIVTRRVMGKASFVQVEDGSGRIQLYARIGEDSIPAESFALFKDLDLGDFIEARGPLFITKTGEPSLRITAWNLLSKSISPLPIAKEEKQPDGSIVRHNAFSSPELRYRQRYADLAVNPDVRAVFRKRSALIKSIRDFLDGEDFLEVETPVLQALYGGAAAKPFITHHNQLDQDLYLRISFELYLKRLIVGNIERVYEIGRDFRNEGVSFKHNPEFTMLELYAAYMDMYSIMDLTERMVQHVAQRVTPDGNGMIEWRGHRISMLEPWHRKTLREAILEYTDIDYTQYPTVESLQKAIKAAGLDYSPNAKTWGKLVDGLMGDYVEKNLIHPTFLYEYPRDISPFAKSKAGDPNTVERFEGFAAGMELCNAFSELNDPIDQHQRFRDEATNAEGDEANPVDEDYVRALMYGMPTCGGMGIGIDRLAMLFAGKDTVREVILFPHLRQDE